MRVLLWPKCMHSICVSMSDGDTAIWHHKQTHTLGTTKQEQSKKSGERKFLGSRRAALDVFWSVEEPVNDAVDHAHSVSHVSGGGGIRSACVRTHKLGTGRQEQIKKSGGKKTPQEQQSCPRHLSDTHTHTHTHTNYARRSNTTTPNATGHCTGPLQILIKPQNME